MTNYEEVKGGLQGLLIGEVLSTEKHPNADKLTLTKVSVGNGEPLQIVCGAPNVATGQKVVVATVGTTIYPSTGDPLTMRVAKIRSVESHGMICAEDEIGMGNSHDGIMVLPADMKVGTPAAALQRTDLRRRPAGSAGQHKAGVGRRGVCRAGHARPGTGPRRCHAGDHAGR